MSKRTNENCKVNLGLLKGRSITTSVPTIKFNASAEEIEEVYSNSDDEQGQPAPDVKSTGASPKHSGSSHVSETTVVTNESANTSDPWRFFSGIKGKITKSVEGKLTEYKTKTTESEASPKKVKESTASSRSDSEDVSESSISKTCGGLSTTEGAELSTDADESDEHTTSLTENSNATSTTMAPSSTKGLRYRFRFNRKCEETVSADGETVSTTVGTVSDSFIKALQKITTVEVDGADDAVTAEEGVDVLELHSDGVVPPIDLNIENITIREGDVLNIDEVSGVDIRKSVIADEHGDKPVTIFSPTKFVDLRNIPSRSQSTINTSDEIGSRKRRFQLILITSIVFLVLYAVLPLSVYASGYVLGVVSTLAITALCRKCSILFEVSSNKGNQVETSTSIISSLAKPRSAVKEHRPPVRYEVWMNEYPDKYDPQSYSVGGTQPVYLRLQGELLRVSNTTSRVPKRAVHDESLPQSANFTRHRIYNLHGAKIELLPLGLTYIRYWSKKYPICITLDKNQINFNYLDKKRRTKDKRRKRWSKDDENHTTKSDGKHRKSSVAQPQLFSKLSQMDSDDGGRSSNDRGVRDLVESDSPVDIAEDIDPITEKCDLTDQTAMNDFEKGECIFLFARTCRDKETWFQLLSAASQCERQDNVLEQYEHFMKKYISTLDGEKQPLSEASPDQNDGLDARERTPPLPELSTINYLPKFTDSLLSPTCANSAQLLWLNALIARVFYVYASGVPFTTKLRDRIQRKLTTIRLPHFIEELRMTELNIGGNPPVVERAGQPTLDSRGMWVDLDIKYEGNIVLILQTKLNLMRLKRPRNNVEHEAARNKSRSAIFHSDVDDSAESSSDDDGSLATNSTPTSGAGVAIPLVALGSAQSRSAVSTSVSAPSTPPLSTSPTDRNGSTLSDIMAANSAAPAAQSGGRKLIRMVDRIAESRLFRVAAEYRYVRKALEGVSNTELSLRVEVYVISGRLAVNIPPPPSDRFWIGFHPMPVLSLHAVPIVGDLNISLNQVTSWLERRLCREFHKLLVLPNMEDFVIPVIR